MDPYLKYGFVVPITFIIGVLFVYGGTKEWKWLIDPPDWLGFFFPQVLIKILFGSNIAKIYTIVVGWIMVAAALWGLFFL